MDRHDEMWQRKGQETIGNSRHAQRQTNQCARRNAVKHSSAHLTHRQYAAEQYAEHAEQRSRGELAQLNKRARIGDNDACIFQSYEGYEHAYAGNKRMTQTRRNRLYYMPVDISQNKDKKHGTLDKHYGKRFLIRISHRLHYGKREESIKSQSGTLYERLPRPECPEQGCESRNKRRGGKRPRPVYACGCQHRRDDGKYITNGKKCRHSGCHFRTHAVRRAVKTEQREYLHNRCLLCSV